MKSRVLMALSLLALGPSCDVPPEDTATYPVREANALERFEQSLTNADDPKLVARVRLSNTHALEIFDLDGVVGYGEVGTYGVQPMSNISDADLANPVALVRKLAPGRTLPRKLLDFGLRVANARRNGTATPSNDSRLPNVQHRANGSEIRAMTPKQPAPLAAPPIASSALDIVAQAVEHSTADGSIGNNCPWSSYISLWGPLGPFCPNSGSYPWCEQDIAGTGFVHFVDALHLRTRSSAATLCSDEGTVNLKITWGVPGGGIVGSTTIPVLQGTWRQYRILAGCSGSNFPFPNQTCDNHSVKYEGYSPTGGWAHWGGVWNRW